MLNLFNSTQKDVKNGYLKYLYTKGGFQIFVKLFER